MMVSTVKRLLALVLIVLATCASAQQGGGIVFTPPGGGGTPDFPLFAPSGACPGVELGFDTNNGLYQLAAGQVYFCANGEHRGAMNSTGVTLHAAGQDMLDLRAAFTALYGLAAATGAPVTIIAGDSTGSGTAGAYSAIQGGNGTSGNANGGDILIRPGQEAGTGQPGRVLIQERTAATPTIWVQTGADKVSLTADYTNATATMSNTALTPHAPVVAARIYTFNLQIFFTDSVAADGIKIDFDGGTATATIFRAHCKIFDAALLSSTQATALATDFTAAVTTGASLLECSGALVPSATGTFIVRAAQNAHTTGTLTIHRGSYLWIHDTPTP